MVLEALDQLAAVHIKNASRAVRVVGQDRQLPTLPGTCIDTHSFKNDRQESGSDLFASGHDRVVFARVMNVDAELPRQLAESCKSFVRLLIRDHVEKLLALGRQNIRHFRSEDIVSASCFRFANQAHGSVDVFARLQARAHLDHRGIEAACGHDEII